MLAMCVRKTGDTGGTPLQSGVAPTTNGSSSKRTKTRGIKSLRSHVAPKQQAPAEVVATESRHTTTTTTAHVDVACTISALIRDDADGHLIYHKGDVVDSRCKCCMCVCVCVYFKLTLPESCGYSVGLLATF